MRNTFTHRFTHSFTQQAALVAIAVFLAINAFGQSDVLQAQPEGTWVSLNGKIVNPGARHFMLKYEGGEVRVEIKDWAGYHERHDELDGDRVTVYGKVDDQLYDSASINAGSVYIDSLNTYFYSAAMDDDEVSPYLWSTTEPDSFMTIYGTVTGVDRSQNTFTIDKGSRKVTVDTGDMIYSPFDDDGFQRISEGDFVSVNARMNTAFIQGRVLDAADVTTLVASDSQQRVSRAGSAKP